MYAVLKGVDVQTKTYGDNLRAIKEASALHGPTAEELNPYASSTIVLSFPS